MHVRLLDMQQGLIAIQAEVEISRKYIQHIRSVRAPVIYEIESILKKHSIEYRIWNSKVRDYITNIIDNHQIKLNAPKLPAIPWKPMICVAITIASMNVLKLMGIKLQNLREFAIFLINTTNLLNIMYKYAHVIFEKELSNLVTL